MSIEQIRSIREDQRETKGGWLWDTKTAAAAVGCHPRKFGDWQRRTWEKLLELIIAQPGETAAAARLPPGRRARRTPRRAVGGQRSEVRGRGPEV